MEIQLWLLPAALILVKFLLKMFIDRKVDLPEFISGVLALPIDIAFLAASLLVGLIIVDVDNVNVGLAIFTVGIIVGILAVFLWRRTEAAFETDHFKRATGLFFVNLAMTSTSVVYVINLLADGKLP